MIPAPARDRRVCVLIILCPFGPYRLTLIIARRLGRFPARIVPGQSADSFAICMCACNEAPIIDHRRQGRESAEPPRGGRGGSGHLDLCR